MKSNPFGTAKKLGFGLMRLPTLEDSSINLPLFCDMVDSFIKNGFTYFDTAYMYHNGTSESAVREALVNRYPRESYTLATKLPIWMVEGGKEALTPFFNRQREKTGVEYFDYYLLHAIDNENIAKYDEHDCWNWALEMKEKGFIRHLGFSFHGTAELLDELLTKHPEFEFVQLQINYLDWDDEKIQSGKCYAVAEKHNMPVIVMEPVKGGTLANLPENASAIFKNYDSNASAPSWALRFCLSLKNVCMILSGMSVPEQLNDNMQTFLANKPLSPAEADAVKSATAAILEIPVVPCTACGYCESECPQKLAIPKIISCVNSVKRYSKTAATDAKYAECTNGTNTASQCLACGGCESVCPQHIKISEVMREAAEIFDN